MLLQVTKVDEIDDDNLDGCNWMRKFSQKDDDDPFTEADGSGRRKTSKSARDYADLEFVDEEESGMGLQQLSSPSASSSSSDETIVMTPEDDRPIFHLPY